MFGSYKDFIGHIGGDDFIIITDVDSDERIADGIIADFDSKIVELYTQGDVKRGYITTVDRLGNYIDFPIMTISIAIVSNEKRRLFSALQVSEIAAEVKKKAKSIVGSAKVKDQRRE